MLTSSPRCDFICSYEKARSRIGAMRNLATMLESSAIEMAVVEEEELRTLMQQQEWVGRTKLLENLQRVQRALLNRQIKKIMGRGKVMNASTRVRSCSPNGYIPSYSSSTGGYYSRSASVLSTSTVHSNLLNTFPQEAATINSNASNSSVSNSTCNNNKERKFSSCGSKKDSFVSKVSINKFTSRAAAIPSFHSSSVSSKLGSRSSVRSFTSFPSAPPTYNNNPRLSASKLSQLSETSATARLLQRRSMELNAIQEPNSIPFSDLNPPSPTITAFSGIRSKPSSPM